MFAYCNNNPANMSDTEGERPYREGKHGEYTDARTGRCSSKDDGDFIYDQTTCHSADWPLGLSTVGDAGCGLLTAYNIIFSRDKSTSFATVWILSGKFNALVNNGKDGTYLGAICDIINFLDPSIRITGDWSEAEQVIIDYGYYNNGIRTGGHFAAAINQGNGRYKIYNGLFCNSLSVNLEEYAKALYNLYYDESTESGCKVDVMILYH